MNFKSIIGLLLLLFICACNQTKQNASVQFYSEASSDENQQLESLIKEFYKWTEFESSGIDFETLENLEDSTYDRLDMVAHQKRLDELRSSNFFSEGFLAHYDSLAMRIDQGLKDKSLVYPIGELPPYGTGADPWCNCQDHPDSLYQSVVLKDIIVKNDKASFYWTWGDNVNYPVITVKEAGVWKIDYLDGFDDKNMLN